MTAKKTTTTKAPAKPKVVKPKFGQVGFKFPVMATIVEVEDGDNQDCIFSVKIDMGDFYDWYGEPDGQVFQYTDSQNFKDFYASCDPKFVKVQKQEELKQAQDKVKEAQALVAKLTKELAEIK